MGQKIGWTIIEIVNNGNDKISPTDLVTDLTCLVKRIKKVTLSWEELGEGSKEGRVAKVLNPAIDNFLFEIKGIRPERRIS